MQIQLSYFGLVPKYLVTYQTFDGTNLNDPSVISSELDTSGQGAIKTVIGSNLTQVYIYWIEKYGSEVANKVAVFNMPQGDGIKTISLVWKNTDEFFAKPLGKNYEYMEMELQGS